ncbi:MAG: TolC family protein, partial [Parachlamydiaceae bacterium]|nr:TolC family protein [Parachlamydiaceae bacterium]
ILLLSFSIIVAEPDIQGKSPEFNQQEELEDAFEIDLVKGVNLALTAKKRLGQAFGNLQKSEIATTLAANEFALKLTPKGDAGFIGGGKAGGGSTIAAGVELSKKFTHGTRIAFYPSIAKIAKDYLQNLKASITQPLLRGFGKEYTLSALYGAQFSDRSARRSLYLAQVRVMLQAIQSMLEVSKQKTLVGFDRETYERLKKFCVSTEMKEKIGLCDSLDVYRAKTELKRAEDALNTSLERFGDAKDTLREALALPLDLPIEVQVPIEYNPVDITMEEAITVALSNRIELDQVEDQLIETRRLQRIAKKNLWPELNLVIDYTNYGRDEVFSNSWTHKRESKWGFGFTTNANVERFSETAAFEQSVIAVDDAGINVAQTRDNIVLDVKRTLRTLTRAVEKIAVQESQIINARNEYHLARLKFEHGLANNFDLIQAEKNLISAQTALIGAIIEHRVNEFKLLASLGTLVDKPESCR